MKMIIKQRALLFPLTLLIFITSMHTSERAGMQCNNATPKFNFWYILMPGTLPQMQKFLHHNALQ